MTSVASQLTEEITAHAQTDSLEDAREICAEGNYFPKNLRIIYWKAVGLRLQLSPSYNILCNYNINGNRFLPCTA